MEDKEKQAGWEQKLLQELATDALREKRNARRWGIFFKSLMFLYIGVLIYAANGDMFGTDSIKVSGKAGEHTALIDLVGVIAPEEGVSADDVVTGLRDAFEDESTKAVILRINSPGGSPVQSSYIYKEIKRLRDKHKEIPLYAVVSDICASGGYYVASAADKIYANESSIVGSIGVLMNGFGFVDAMDDLGVERRLMTAGEHKGMLDPFSPVKEEDQKHVQVMLDDLHNTFIDVVKEGRGDRLSDDPKIFSGMFWSGNKAVELGLVDGIGSAGYVAREVVGAEDIVDFTKDADPLEKLVERMGASAARSLQVLYKPDISAQLR